MTVHFICRGNTFRSVMAEAYLKSLHLKDVQVISSGTVAEQDRLSNIPKFQHTLAQLDKHSIKQYAKPAHGEQLPAGERAAGDIAVVFSERAYRELARVVPIQDNVRIWHIADIGEPGRIPKNEADEQALREDVYQEIVAHVDALVTELKLKPAN